MLRDVLTPAEPPRWMRFYERFIPEDPPKDADVTAAPEALDHLEPVDQLPKTPLAFARFVVGHHFKWHVAGLFAAIGVGIIADSLAPYALSQIVDGLTAGLETGDMNGNGIMLWFAVLVGFWLVAAISFRVYDAIDIYTSPRMRATTQKYLFRYLLKHSPRYFQDNFAGRLSQKVRNAGQSINALNYLVVRELTQVIVLLAVSLVLLFREDWGLAVILVGWSILYIGLATFLARHCIVLSRNMAERWSTTSGKVVDSISNMDVVRAFARTGHERRYVSHFWFREMVGSMRFRWFLTIMRAAQSLAVWLLNGILVGFAVWQVVAGHLSLGGFTMVFVLVTLLGRTLRQLSFQILDFFEFLGNLTEALEIITEPHEIVDKPGAPAIRISDARIRFENVHFEHKDGNVVFEDLSLEIAPGEKVGLVGRSGAGKSTLVKLLRRQFEPQKGRILIDGQDITDVTWDSLNEAIAEVPQVPGIFHRSIRDNIRYHEPSADQEQVEHAAALSHAAEFITRRKTTYDTMVGEQGIKLSGGERQRVAIARAFMKNAQILVLDEATSALDSEAEHLIQQALFELMQGRTVIAIAHRLSTITGMDRIVLLDRGRIIEQGSHQDLLDRGGAYAQLWTIQAGGFVEMGGGNDAS